LGYETLTAGTVNTFSNGGVDLITGDGVSFGGPATGPTLTPRGFVGSIVVYPLTGSCVVPESGSINVVNGLGGCPNENRLYFLNGYIPGQNITYQWQVAPTPTGAFVNVGGNTTLLSRQLTVNSYFRCIATCGTNRDTTAVFADTIKPFFHCYCLSEAVNIDEDRIDSVYINNSIRTGSSVALCQTYTDYRVPSLMARVRTGSTLSVRSKHGLCNGTFVTPFTGAVFADFSRNGAFELAERFGTGFNIFSTGETNTSNFNIPLNSPLGITGLRVIYSTISPAPTTACGTYGWGETEDYLIEIIKDSIDARMNFIDSLENGCGLTTLPIRFNATNIGINNINPLTVSYSINGGAPVTESFANLEKDSTRTYTFATLGNLSTAGLNRIRVWHFNSKDTNRTNDTLFKTIQNFPIPPIPLVKNDTICNGSPSTILRATSNDSFVTKWYTDSTGQNFLLQSNQIVIQNPTQDTSLYAKSVYTQTTNIGLVNSAPEIGLAGTGMGINFDIFRQGVRINSVKAKFNSTGVAALEIRNAFTNALVASTSFIVPSPGVFMTIPINASIPVGSYRMILSNNPGVVIATQQFSSFPFILPNVMRLSSSTTANQYNVF
jgi:hypothetical protein